MKEIFDKFNKKFTDFLGNGGGYTVFVVALIAIAFAIVGFYLTNGFDWKWFVFFHLPLYAFCGWALWAAFKMYRNTMKRREVEEEIDLGDDWEEDKDFIKN